MINDDQPSPAVGVSQLDEELATELDRLVTDMTELAKVLDEEAQAALAGDSRHLTELYRRKLTLAAALEARNQRIRGLLAETSATEPPAKLSDDQRSTMIAAHHDLLQAVARNEMALRAATDAIRRIFASAARALVAEDIGYGPGRLAGDARLFRPRTV